MAFHFRDDFERMESDYVRTLEEAMHKRNKRVIYVAGALLATVMIVVTILNTRTLGLNPEHNVTEISWTPAEMNSHAQMALGEKRR